MSCEDLDDIRHPHNGCSRSCVDELQVWYQRQYPTSSALLSGTHIVLIGIDGLGVECLFANLFMLHDVLAHPYVPIDAKDDIYPTRECEEVGLQSSYEDWRHCDKLTISEL